MDTAKRVILRLREVDFDIMDPSEAIRFYFQKMDYSLKQLEDDRHFIHIQPSNAHISQKDPQFHVIIDMNKTAFSGPLEHDFPHEIYVVRRNDGQLYVELNLI